MKITVNYIGNLKTNCIHTGSGSEIITDAPKDNAGEGLYFSPTDLLATSLVTCMITTMAIVAKKNQLPDIEAHGTVEKIMANDPRRVGKLVVEIVVTSPVAESDKRILERAALHCPVVKSLSSAIEIIHQITFASIVLSK
ncbi:MAG: OsmC family protein [Bacteroidia bacterium]|nr:OsmC family protein [Bacteroidia bacterium]